MKSKRRHELQTNELADRIGQWLEKVRPYSTTMTLAAVGLVAIVGVWYYMTNQKHRKQGEAWRSYLRAGVDPQADPATQLGEVADDFNGTVAGVWAAQTTADIELSRGVRLLFTDRALAETSLNLAKSRYHEVLENKFSKRYPLLRQRATYGLAQAHEALNELDDAKNHFEEVVQSDPDSALAKAAEKRVARLNASDVKKWYNWFAHQKPLPRNLGTDTSSPLGTGLGGSSSGLGSLPEMPGDDFLKDDTGAPSTGESATTGDESGADSTEATGKPKSDADTKPGGQPESSATEPSKPAKKSASSAESGSAVTIEPPAASNDAPTKAPADAGKGGGEPNPSSGETGQKSPPAKK